MYQNPLAEFPARVRLRLVRDGDPPVRRVINEAEKVYELVGSYLSDLPREVLLAIYLDNRNQLLGIEELSMGTTTESLVSPAEIMKSALLASAENIILVHNHPSGVPTPSQADKHATQAVKEACRLLGLHLLDHIIIGRDNWHSMLGS